MLNTSLFHKGFCCFCSFKLQLKVSFASYLLQKAKRGNYVQTGEKQSQKYEQRMSVIKKTGKKKEND